MISLQVLINKDLFVSFKGEFDAIEINDSFIVFWYKAQPIIMKILEGKNAVYVTVPSEMTWRLVNTSIELRSKDNSSYLFISSKKKKIAIT